MRCAVGLTALEIQDQFDDYRESTIGAAFLTQTIALDETTTVKFEIWYFTLPSLYRSSSADAASQGYCRPGAL
jgi:hypothetical protein